MITKLNKFQGAAQTEFESAPLIPTLKSLGIKQVGTAFKKKGSANAFILAKDAKGNDYSFPCGPSVESGDLPTELHINGDGVVFKMGAESITFTTI